MTTYTRIGRNDAVGTSFETLRTYSTVLWVPPTVAQTFSIVSGNIADDAASTGLRTLRVLGLNGAQPVEETVTMDGTTPAVTVKSYTFISSIEALTAGSGGVAAGAITATGSTDSVVTSGIVAGDVANADATFLVPVGSTATVSSVWLQRNSNTAGTSTAQLMVLRSDSSVWVPMLTMGAVTAASVDMAPPVSINLNGGDAVRLDVKSTAGVVHYGGFTVSV